MKLPDISAGRWIHEAFAWVKQGSATNEKEAGMAPALTGQRRRHERTRKPFTAELSLERGKVQVQGIELNDFGAAVLSPLEVPLDSVIFIQLRPGRLVGFAHVRHCTVHGKGSYVLGLEFRVALMPGESGGWNYQRVAMKAD